jgi:hypothetical protein
MRPEDPDDWFSDESVPADEDWGDREGPAPRRPRPSIPGGLDLSKAAIGAGILLLAIVAGLWIGGAFSSSKKHTPPPPPPTTTAQTTTTTPKPQAPPAPATALNPGAKGDQVKRLQRALKHLGYSPGTIDGDYGPSTQAALEKFQKAQGLTADGVLGPKTLLALKHALQNAG